jgi:putative mRNA 3-end processing factor
VALLETDSAGIYCPPGDFHIDPWGEAARAIITHAHSGHAHSGSRDYLTMRAGEALLRARIGSGPIHTVEYGERVTINGVTVSLHPAGHMLGAAQVRVEYRGEIWVVSGDYKLQPDATCAAFEPLRCDTFVTEATFALPIFRWAPEQEVIASIHEWWRSNQEAGKACVLFVYPIGKAQRILAALDQAIGPIHSHETVEHWNRIYRQQDIAIPASAEISPHSLIVAPPSAIGSRWVKSLGPVSTALASGWMRIRGTRRRRSLDRGFVLSDHADWDELLRAIDETGAANVWVMHGFRGPLVRWLEEHGRHAVPIETRFEEDEA